jgi:hypothetical protein
VKRLSLALAAIGLSSAAFAAFPGASNPCLVDIPELAGRLVFGATGYYLQPSATNGDLDYASANQNTTTPFRSNLGDITPNYSWGWGANLGYIFPQTGNDINLSYMQINSGLGSNLLAAVIPGTSINSLNPIISLPAGYSLFQFINSAGSTVEYDIDQVDLTVGQYINVGCRVRVHPNVGLRYAQIQRKIFQTFTGTDQFSTTISEAAGSNETSNYTGIGPLVGVDGSYYLGMGFGFVGHFDAAELIGNIQSNLNTTFIGPTATSSLFPTTQVFPITTPTRDRLVPELDGKLGFDYTYLFNNAANSDLTLEVGWQASKDFNAIDRVGATLVPNTIGGALASQTIGARRTDNLSVEGPYATLTLHV